MTHFSLCSTPLLVAASLLLSGCTTYTQASNIALFVRNAPAPTLVPRGQEFASAEASARQLENAFALIGSGRSMEPMYMSGTAVVVHEQSYRTLRPGMLVIYRSSGGKYVAHMLLKELRGGWLAIGVNNRMPDHELVTRRNFVGVVQAAFASADTLLRAAAAARTIASEELGHLSGPATLPLAPALRSHRERARSPTANPAPAVGDRT